MGAVRHDELVLAAAEDVWVWDEHGRRCFDATAALWYANVGHGYPPEPGYLEGLEALCRQHRRLSVCTMPMMLPLACREPASVTTTTVLRSRVAQLVLGMAEHRARRSSGWTSRQSGARGHDGESCPLRL
jgi:hypothetical protein